MYNRIENLLVNVSGAIIAGALFVTFAGDAHANEREPSHATSAAIAALYVANDDVQKAVTSDVCDDDDMSTNASRALTGDDANARENVRQYMHVRGALQHAFAASHGGDNSLDIVRADFCFAASER